jgi:hypothetical protein
MFPQILPLSVEVWQKFIPDFWDTTTSTTHHKNINTYHYRC